MRDSVIQLVFDNPDGTQKQWVGKTYKASDRLTVCFGKVGASLQRRDVPRSSFSSVNVQLDVELQARADKKRRDGYYDDPNSSPTSGALDPAPVPSEPIKRGSVLAALDDNDSPEWFFWPSNVALTNLLDQSEKRLKSRLLELCPTGSQAREALILSSVMDDTLPTRVNPGRAS